MQLSESDKELLFLLESNAGLSFRQLAQIAKRKEHAVRRGYHRLVERGIITGRSLYVDTMRLGYTDYALYFSINSTNQREQASLLNTLKKSSLVRWLADVGGGYDYAVTFLSRSVHEVREFVDTFSRRHQDSFLSKQLALRTYMVRYPRRYLSPHRHWSAEYVMGDHRGTVDIDATDRRILNLLSNSKFERDNAVARAAQISPSALVHRMNALRKKGVLLGDTYRVDLNCLGYNSFRVLITMKRLGADLRQRVLAFCRKHIAVRILVESFGSWDYEMELELPNSRAIKHFTNALQETFPHDIYSIQVIPIFAHLKYSGFPAQAVENTQKR